MSDQDKSGSGEGGAEKPASVDIDAIVSKVTEALTPVISQQITGAVKRNVGETLASQFDGIDFDALKGFKPPAPKGDNKKGEDENTPDAGLELSKLRQELDAEKAEAAKWRAVGLRARVLEVVDSNNASKGARDLLADKYVASVQLTDSGELAYKVGDEYKPLGDVVKSFLKDRPDLLKSDARPGTGAGNQSGAWTEAMPSSMAELMKDKNGKQTPERWAQFAKAHPEKAAELRKSAGGGFTGGIAGIQRAQ
jgi:hypothetical protein